MTSYQFDCLDEMQKFEAWYNAEYIGRKYDGEQLLECKKIKDFYVVYKIKDGVYTHFHYLAYPTQAMMNLYK